jgi:predicted RNase H-like HicB family nuclease
MLSLPYGNIAFQGRRGKMKSIKIIIEKHADGYVAYPLGLKGVVVGEGDTYDETLTDVKSAIRFHIDTFGAEVLTGKACARKRTDFAGFALSF